MKHIQNGFMKQKALSVLAIIFVLVAAVTRSFAQEAGTHEHHHRHFHNGRYQHRVHHHKDAFAHEHHRHFRHRRHRHASMHYNHYHPNDPVPHNMQ